MPDPTHDTAAYAISLEEAAARLGIGMTLAREMVHRGEIPSKRLGRRIIIPVCQFEAWLAEAG